MHYINKFRGFSISLFFKILKQIFFQNLKKVITKEKNSDFYAYLIKEYFSLFLIGSKIFFKHVRALFKK